MSGRAVPKYTDLLWPTLEALKALGGSASGQEIADRIAFDLDLPDEILNMLHKEGPLTIIEYRAGWARSYLKKIGAVANTERGVWMITPLGRNLRSGEETKKRVREKQREDGGHDTTWKTVPKYTDLLWPTLKALEALGGSASVREIADRIAFDLDLPDEILNTLHKAGPQTALAYNAGWARTHLKNIGAVANTERGVWVITPQGRKLRTEEEVRERQHEDFQRRQAGGRGDEGGDDVEADASMSEEQDWKRELLDLICTLTPKKFEHLCRRVLLESGFTKVEVTGGPGDRGIDGFGVLPINKFLSFRILFQCKRFSSDHAVTPKDIRNFRGAMTSHVDKGLFITTGRYTSPAQKDAEDGGDRAIDLIDGNALCELMKDLRLGVETVRVSVHKVKPEFFKDI